MNKFSSIGQNLIYNPLTTNKIEKYLNKQLEYNFRTTPYDLENSDDLIELINTTLLEFLDVKYYLFIFEFLYESIDKTLLNCQTPLYADTYCDNNISDDIVKKNVYSNSVDSVEKIFDDFSEYSHSLIRDLQYLFNFLFRNSSKNAFLLFWGFNKANYSINLDSLLDNLDNYSTEFIKNILKSYECCDMNNVTKFIDFIKFKLKG